MGCSSSSWSLMSLFILVSLLVVAVGASRTSINIHEAKAAAPAPAPAPAQAPGGICDSIVKAAGYQCQEFDVQTDDGYILKMQRIPEGRAGGGGGTKKPPVLVQHGVLADAACWLLNSSPQQSLGFILADSGFDVWFANVRGTASSRRHVKLDPNNPAFWNWSWDELVAHDLPAFVNLVFQQTGQKTHYVGHSLGTLMALASFTEGKQDKVKSAALLSPIAYLSHMTTPLGVIGAKSFGGEVEAVFGLAEFNPKLEPAASLARMLCAQTLINCYDFLTAFTGKNCCLNATTLQGFMKYEPQPTSTKNLVHLAQTVRDGVLRKFDYGPIINMQQYKAAQPPAYNLGNIPRDLPIFMSYGAQDALSDVQDVQTLLQSLKSHDPAKLQVQLVKEYAHMDFIMASNAKDVVFNQVVAFFRKFN